MSNRVRERRRRRSIPPTRSSIFFSSRNPKKILFGGLISLSPLFSGSVPMNQPPFSLCYVRLFVRGREASAEKTTTEIYIVWKWGECRARKRISLQKAAMDVCHFPSPAPPRPAPIHKKPCKRKKVENNYCKSNNPLHTYPIAVLVQLFYITIVV